ncbi:hypothetical protein IFO70_33805 [Phormidium tenue FACHB-886]|nr:hypothetical protein [Phormidium tenue FACHB-886]
MQLLYGAMVVFSMGQPIGQTCLTGAMSRSMSADMQGRVQGSIAVVMAIAQVFGPLWAGSIQTIVAVAVMLVAIPELNRLNRKNRAINYESNHYD